MLTFLNDTTWSIGLTDDSNTEKQEKKYSSM